MKKLLLLYVLFISLYSFSNAQDLDDTIDFIKENIEANIPLPNYDNLVFTINSILKKDADNFSGKTLSNAEFKNLFGYGRDIYLSSNQENSIGSVIESVDIRGMEKVSTTRKTGKHNYFIITIYMSGDYFARKYSSSSNEPEISDIDKMKILISDNSEVATKIKKAIIHLGKLKGVTVKDGDFF